MATSRSSRRHSASTGAPLGVALVKAIRSVPGSAPTSARNGRSGGGATSGSPGPGPAVVGCPGDGHVAPPLVDRLARGSDQREVEVARRGAVVARRRDRDVLPLVKITAAIRLAVAELCERTLVEHREILALLTKRDAEGAKGVLRQHLNKRPMLPIYH